ncbi:chloramphenicol phosphotransferase CPT family protein [Hyphomonas pacifica]|uniref:chloramphenicol phosphotransferase CPT family protein n=1 Tax=Hyphomonas pacifica TaxID=1280941 RepID=UPI000DBF5685|nr:AAA family ATPase [Hyphomonas pacifica]RAN36630.1 hypothetical protein HY11_11835 [Hyphomonas pacifica]
MNAWWLRDRMAIVIILNGTTSAGKTSLAHALQDVTSQPFLHVRMDDFLTMQPRRLDNHPEGFVFERVEGAGPPEVSIKTGLYGAKLMSGMRQAVAAMADSDLNMIVDDVWLREGAEQADYIRLLSKHQVFFVGVNAPLAILEQRELARGDRDIGQARWQYGRVHVGATYDLKIDTGEMMPQQAALKIQEAFSL